MSPLPHFNLETYYAQLSKLFLYKYKMFALK